MSDAGSDSALSRVGVQRLRARAGSQRSARRVRFASAPGHVLVAHRRDFASTERFLARRIYEKDARGFHGSVSRTRSPGRVPYFCSWSPGLQAQTDPIIGTWRLNVAKSKYDPGPAPMSETRIYEALGTNGIKSTHNRVEVGGNKATICPVVDLGRASLRPSPRRSFSAC